MDQALRGGGVRSTECPSSYLFIWPGDGCTLKVPLLVFVFFGIPVYKWFYLKSTLRVGSNCLSHVMTTIAAPMIGFYWGVLQEIIEEKKEIIL